MQWPLGCRWKLCHHRWDPFKFLLITHCRGACRWAMLLPPSSVGSRELHWDVWCAGMGWGATDGALCTPLPLQEVSLLVGCNRRLRVVMSNVSMNTRGVSHGLWSSKHLSHWATGPPYARPAREFHPARGRIRCSDWWPTSDDVVGYQ